MKTNSIILKKLLILIILVSVNNRCITEFVPDIKEDEELLVVEGLITDQPEPYIIKISKSLPIGLKSDARPLSGCAVTVSDEQDFRTRFNESIPGTYVSPPEFRGIVGKTYKVHISAPFGQGVLNYDSKPATMLPVQSIDDLYYEKVLVKDAENDLFDVEACQIYFNSLETYYGSKYLRWEYYETWVIRLPFSVPNQRCWISDRSRNIMIRNSAVYGKANLIRYPVTYISEATDRLKTKYSIEVNQYSMNEDEYNFWAALQSLTEQSGGLYDLIPASVPGNLKCVERPGQTVLGYFSVSAKSSRRIFIDEEFAGTIDLYTDCITDTVFGDESIPGLDTTVWVLFDKPAWFPNPHTRILTRTLGCYDCRVRGTNVKPEFWIGD